MPSHPRTDLRQRKKALGLQRVEIWVHQSLVKTHRKKTSDYRRLIDSILQAELDERAIRQLAQELLLAARCGDQKAIQLLSEISHRMKELHEKSK